MAASLYSNHIPRCQHVKTNGVQCGSPSLHHKRFCYFHNRWRAATVNLKRASTARSASIFELPVLEDADSVQVTLMQVMRLIFTRQLDHKTAGLILYALQTASTNLRRTTLDTQSKKEVIIDPRNLANTSVGEDAWSPDDFEAVEEEEEEEEDDEENEDDDDEEEDDDEDVTTSVARAPSPAMRVTTQPAQPEPKSPRPAEQSSLSQAAERQKNLAQGASPGNKGPQSPQAPEGRHNTQSHYALKALQQVEAILKGDKHASLSDLKTSIQLSGLYPPRPTGSEGK